MPLWIGQHRCDCCGQHRLKLQDSGSGSTVLETTAQNIAFDAGGTADAQSSHSPANPMRAAGQVSITYDGNALTPVIDHAGSQPSIWLLNLGGTSYAGGSATLVLDMTGVSTVNGYGLGIVSVDASGDDIEVHDSNTNASPGGDTSGQSVSLTTTETSFVVAAHRTTPAAAARPPTPRSTRSTASISVRRLVGPATTKMSPQATHRSRLHPTTTRTASIPRLRRSRSSPSLLPRATGPGRAADRTASPLANPSDNAREWRLIFYGKRPHAHPTAFTLIELLVVISIIALLIAILLPAHWPGQAQRDAGPVLAINGRSRSVGRTTQPTTRALA